MAFLRGRWIFDALTPGIMLLLLFLVPLFLTLRDATAAKTLQQVLRTPRENSASPASSPPRSGSRPACRRRRRCWPAMHASVAISMTPAREVGGDLYDFFRLDGRRLFFMVGDVAGKGLSASIMR
jgi:serine phosphatase RsbU (regulator of sigma subunit)